MRESRDQATDTAPLLATGAPIRVWCRSLGTWSGGFAVSYQDDGRYRVRRVSDGWELPGTFNETEVSPG